MMLPIVYTMLLLLAVVALNWRRFEGIGWGKSLRLLLVWMAVFIGGAALLRVFGIA